jgi:cytochrome c oxidase cbb3-type subunit 3
VKTVQREWQIVLMLSGTLVAGGLALRAQQPSKNETPPTNVDAGKRIFERHCALCHGIDGKGGRGAALNRARLSHAPDDAALKSVITNGIAPNMPEAWYLNDEEITNVAAFVRSLSKVPADPIPGDAARGASVYAKSACGLCHILDGAGRGYGPELTGIGERRSATFLKQIIQKPASSLPEDFLFVKATTRSGEAVEGIRVNEDSFTIQIKDASSRYHSLRKDALRDLQKRRGESPMPAFEGVLSDGDLQDLVAYLVSPRGKP